MFSSSRTGGFVGRVCAGGHRRGVVVLAAVVVLVACADGTAPPSGRLGHSFEIGIRDTSWEGSVFGLVDTSLVSVDAPGCVALVGEIRPTSLPGVVSSGIDVPGIGLSVGGAQLNEATSNSCDVGDLEAAGYGPIRHARVTVGTAYRFYRVFHLPAGTVTPHRPLVGSVGALGRVAESFEPRLLDSVHSPEPPPPVPVTEHHTLLPAGSGFAYPDGETPWEGTVLGLVNSEQIPVPPPFATGAATRSGRCVLIVGWLRVGGPTGEASPPVPSFDLIADGNLVGGGGKRERCDTTEPAFAGFGPIHIPLTVATGDAYPFYQEVFIPETIPGTPEAITVRYPWSEEQWFVFEPAVLPHLPDSLTYTSARSRSRPLLPVGDPAVSTFDSGFAMSRGSDSGTTIDSVEWEGSIQGLVPVPTTPSLSDTHRCLAVVGTLTVTRFEGFDLTVPPLRPDLGLIIEGRRTKPSSPQDCDTSQLQKLGYLWFGTTGKSVGSDDSFYETFTLTPSQADGIQAVVAGSVWFSNFSFFEPTTLHTIPAA